MKLKALLAALFVAGLAASLALASPGKGRPSLAGTTGTGTTASSGATTTGERHGRDEDDAGADERQGGKSKSKCREVELKGTLANGSLALSVDRANKAGRALGGTVSVSFAGRVKLHARLCRSPGAAAAETLQLRDLKVEGRPADTTTMTTTTTSS